MTNTKAILGITMAAIFAIALPFATADTPDYLKISSSETTTGTFVQTTDDRIPQLTNSQNGGNNQQQGAVTFWSWIIDNSVDTDNDDIDESITVGAVAIHHAFNDHSGNDQSLKSSPVQGFHPHTVTVNATDFCVLGLTSPTWDFRVQDDTVTLEAEGETTEPVPASALGGAPEDTADTVNGWINPSAACDYASGLQVTGASIAQSTPLE